jgi:DNA repair protein RadD
VQQLRPYQQCALDSLRGEFRAGKLRICLVAPTGSGKTTIASHIVLGAVAKGKRVVFVVHRKELADQASTRLDSHGVDHGVVMADHPRRRPGCAVQVCSISTLLRRLTRPAADLLILDECSHAAAKSWVNLRESYPAARAIGLTATPWRLDGKGLAEHFDSSVVAATPKELIASGHLVNYAGYRYLSPDVSDVGMRGGDYERQGLELACSRSQIVGNVVGEWVARASTLRTIVFAVSLSHARLLADAFREQGVAAETVDYSMGREEREGILHRVQTGETRVICNVNLLTEGYDVPALECVVLARPTKSLALYLQMVGRVMRTSPGKQVARIHDHGGLVDRFGLPDEERDYSLRASRTTAPPTVALTTCKACFAIFARAENGAACPECGTELPAPKRKTGPEEVDGLAVDIRSAAAERRERDAWLRQAVEICLSRGYQPGWVVHQHSKRFPNAPKPWGSYREVRARMGRSPRASFGELG